ncbi:unnamed protein product, partial [Amoebophrya sp. A25]|eukprot:GSA25T00005522001.1
MTGSCGSELEYEEEEQRQVQNLSALCGDEVEDAIVRQDSKKDHSDEAEAEHFLGQQHYERDVDGKPPGNLPGQEPRGQELTETNTKSRKKFLIYFYGAYDEPLSLEFRHEH